MHKILPILVLATICSVFAVFNIEPAYAATVQVTISNGAANTKGTCSPTSCFNPQTVNIAVGDTVTWTNADTIGHTATSGQPLDNQTGTVFDSSIIQAGSAYSFTFQNAGTYYYYDQFHPWMTGIVIVGSSGQSLSTQQPTQSSSSTIASQASSDGMLEQQVTTEKGIFYAEGIIEQSVSGNAKIITIPVIYKNTQNKQDQIYSFDFKLQDTKGNSHTAEDDSTWPNVQVLPNDIIRGDLKFVMGADVEPSALIYSDFGFNAYLDVTKTLSTPDQKPKSDLNSANEVLNNGELQLKVTNEYLSGNNPVIYNVSVELDNISDQSVSVFPQEFYAKDQDGNVYSINWDSSVFTSGEIYPGASAHGDLKFQMTGYVPTQVMLIYDKGFGSATINTGFHSVAFEQTPIPQSANNVAPNPQNSMPQSQNTTNQLQNNQTSSQTVSPNPEVLDFSGYGLKKGEWAKYKIEVNVTAQNQYTEFAMKSGLQQAAVSAFEEGNNMTINSLNDLDWYKKTINDISKDHLSVNTITEIRGQPMAAFDSEGMQAGVPYSLAIPITTKIGDSLPTYDNSTSMPTSLIVTGVVNDQVGGQNVESYELFGQKDSVDANGIAKENNVTAHYEKQTGILLDSSLDGKYGSPVLGVADVHVYTTALDLFIPENEAVSQTSSTNQSIVPIPSWIHKTAKWWAEGSVGDNDFVKGIQYLVQQKILVIPKTTTSNTNSTNQIPPWVKGVAGWWADGKISDSEFVRGMQFLVQAGIIKV